MLTIRGHGFRENEARQLVVWFPLSLSPYVLAPDNFEMCHFESRHGRQQPIKSRYDDNLDMQISRLEGQQPIKLPYDRSKQEMRAFSDRWDHELFRGYVWQDVSRFAYKSIRLQEAEEYFQLIHRKNSTAICYRFNSLKNFKRRVTRYKCKVESRFFEPPRETKIGHGSKN